MRLLLAVLLLVPGLNSTAQEASDIYLLELSTMPEFVFVQSIRAVAPQPGYDNQPYFSPDSKHLYFTSGREGQTDIYRVKTGKKRAKKVTCTPESEYSASLAPFDDGSISVVRVESDSSQQLRLYGKKCREGERIYAEYDSVAYYTWFGAGNIAMYLLSKEHQLKVLDSLGNVKVEYANPGRCLQPIPNSENFSFVWKKSQVDWWLCSLNENGALKKLADFKPGYEDYAWMPDGRLVWPQGSTIIVAQTGEVNETPFSFDLKDAGIKNVSRVAVSPDGKWMAVVAAE